MTGNADDSGGSFNRISWLLAVVVPLESNCRADSGIVFRSPFTKGGGGTGEVGAEAAWLDNRQCFVYDTLHRITDEQTSSANECRRMRYDATANGVQSTPSGYPSSGANIVGHLVEAETDNCSVYPPTSASKITDEWFAYDKDGRTTDVWESTPNSGGYYHTTVVYDADGTVTSAIT